MAIDTTIRRSRRSLLAGAFGGLVAVATQAFRPLAVRAEGETIHVGDNHLTATSATWLKNTTTDSDVLRGETTRAGRGVYGISRTGVGVHGKSASAVGVLGETAASSGAGIRGDNSADSGVGVRGRCPGISGIGVIGEGRGIGVRGVSYAGFGVFGATTQGVAIQGQIDDPYSTYSAIVGYTDGRGAGVNGRSRYGRGGVFHGATAQVRLEPADGSHPASGQAGDLYVDDRARLWFCRGDTTWVRLA